MQTEFYVLHRVTGWCLFLKTFSDYLIFVAYRGNRISKKNSSQNFADPKAQLTARRPFVVKNGHLKPFLCRSVWQTQTSQLHLLTVKFKLCPKYFGAIKKLKPTIVKKVILGHIYTHTLMKKTNFGYFHQTFKFWQEAILYYGNIIANTFSYWIFQNGF